MLRDLQNSGALNSGSRLENLARHLLLSICFVLLFLALNLPDGVLFSKIGSVAWYPANGLLLAVLLGVNPAYAFLGAFASSLAGVLLYHQPLWSFSQTIGSLAIAGWYGAAALILLGPLRIDRRLRRGKDVLYYVAVTTSAALGSAATGVACLAADRIIPWRAYWSAAGPWFVGDEIGLLGVAPFLLIHILPQLRKRMSTSYQAPENEADASAKLVFRSALLQLPEAAGQLILLALVLWIMFWPPLGHLIFISFVPVLWIAMRQGVRGASTGLVALNFGIVIAVHWLPPPPLLLNRIGLLMFVVSAAGLIVGSTVTERRFVESNLRERTVYLNSLIENSPLGIVVLNRAGRIELANDAFAELFLFAGKSELIGSELQDLFPMGPDGMPWSSQVISGQSLHRTVRRQRRDSRFLDLEMQAVPLLVDGEVRGAYAICRDISEQVRASEAEREHAAALNRLVKELESQAAQMTLLEEMATLLQCCTNVEEAFTVVRKSALKLFPEAKFGALYTFRSSRNLLEAAISWGDFEGTQSIFAPHACWALRRGQPHWSDSTPAAIHCPHLDRMASVRQLCIPMVGQGETLGILDLGFREAGADSLSLRHSQQQLGTAVARQVALSLANLKLHEKLRDQSVRDPLTLLFNRRFMQESLEREFSRARRRKSPLSILFFDVDHFKRFNDNFGHDAGDFVLQAIAGLLRTMFRKDDVSCRYGGEEFAVILPDSLSGPAAVRANMLRAEIRKAELRYRDVSLDPITLSIGVACFPEHCSTPDELVKIADECLYYSKSIGRDCVTVATDLPSLTKARKAMVD